MGKGAEVQVADAQQRGGGGRSRSRSPPGGAKTAKGKDGVIYSDIGLMAPRILLPKEGTDLTKWTVIACDQYTAEPQYWERVEATVGDAPSMLRMIYPEVHLPKGKDAEIINGVLQKMGEYRESGVFATKEPGFVLVDRKTPSAESRLGLVVALDLELYSFKPGSQSLVRPTEKTIEARLPPRVAVRKDAPYESPHILVLIDDPSKTVIEPLAEKRSGMAKLYDFELMEKSGHLVGHHVTGPKDLDGVAQALRALAAPKTFRERYGASEEQEPILFAVGDGNHSLATAKKCWEALKEGGAEMDHPARFALVELNNIHDTGLQFHPIHRLVEGIDPEAALASMTKELEAKGATVTFEEGATIGTGAEAVGGCSAHRIGFVSQKRCGVVNVSKPSHVLAAATLDSWLNPHVQTAAGAELDYVHEEYTIAEKAKGSATTAGFLLPTIDKDDLIKTVVREGTLPRKTFSMGHAPEKRFYLECREILR